MRRAPRAGVTLPLRLVGVLGLKCWPNRHSRPREAVGGTGCVPTAAGTDGPAASCRAHSGQHGEKDAQGTAEKRRQTNTHNWKATAARQHVLCNTKGSMHCTKDYAEQTYMVSFEHADTSRHFQCLPQALRPPVPPVEPHFSVAVLRCPGGGE